MSCGQVDWCNFRKPDDLLMDWERENRRGTPPGFTRTRGRRTDQPVARQKRSSIGCRSGVDSDVVTVCGIGAAQRLPRWKFSLSMLDLYEPIGRSGSPPDLLTKRPNPKSHFWSVGGSLIRGGEPSGSRRMKNRHSTDGWMGRPLVVKIWRLVPRVRDRDCFAFARHDFVRHCHC
jgi:hypothetical protein